MIAPLLILTMHLPGPAAHRGSTPPPAAPAASAPAGTSSTRPALVLGKRERVALACIRWAESRGDYTVVNSLGYAGAYQLSPTYSPTWARRYGFSQWAGVTANRWPKVVQDAVALRLWRDFPAAWAGDGC